MRSKLLFLIVLITGLTALPASVQANYYENPGFEDYDGSGLPDAWSSWGGYNPGGWNYHENDGSARSGGEDCMEVSTASGTDFLWLFRDTPYDIGGTPEVFGDTSYTIGGWFKDVHSGGSTARAEITFEFWNPHRDDGGSKISEPSMQFDVPNDGQWHWIEWSLVSPSGTVMIAPMIGIEGAGEGTYLLDDVWFDTHPPGGAHTPDPSENSKVQAPGLVDLKWENLSAQTCNIYWDDGSADVNDLNFQWHMDNTSEVTLIGTVAASDPNVIPNKTVAADKMYHWRVDVGSLAGIVWMFSTINDPPDVDAGPKQARWQDDPFTPSSETFQMAPTVSDDGLPIPPGTVTYLWTATDPCNPGAVVFAPGGATSTDPAPTATMSVAGDYIIDLVVSDGTLAGSDTVKIRVHAIDTTGLEARYDCEEGNVAVGIHDDYSGYAKNPGDPNPPSRRGERMDDIDEPGMTGTTMDQTGGHTGGGIIFDGESGHVEAYDSSGDPNFESPKWADFRDEVTVGAWIKVDTENGGWDDSWEAVINKGENSYRLHRNQNGDSIQMTVNIDAAEYVATGTTPVNDGAWHHVMGTYDGAEVCIYVDGLLDTESGECVEAEGQIDWVSAGEDVEHALTYGQSKENDAPFGGMMDEIRIHSIGLPWQADNPEAEPVTELNARSVVSIYRTSGGHINCGQVYLPGDADEDCYVNMADVKAMAGNWMECNSIANPRCIP